MRCLMTPSLRPTALLYKRQTVTLLPRTYTRQPASVHFDESRQLRPSTTTLARTVSACQGLRRKKSAQFNGSAASRNYRCKAARVFCVSQTSKPSQKLTRWQRWGSDRSEIKGARNSHKSGEFSTMRTTIERTSCWNRQVTPSDYAQDALYGEAPATITQSVFFKELVTKSENWAILGLFQAQFSPMSSH